MCKGEMKMQRIQRWLLPLVMSCLLLLQVSAAEAAGEPQAETAKPPALALKIDREDIDQLPRNFRTGNDAFTGTTRTGIMPSRQGMDTLNVSASSIFSEKEFEQVLKHVPAAPDKIYVIDLRGESHGYLNGTAVSWFAANNWGNDGRSLDIVTKLEREQLAQAAADSPVQAYRFDDDKNVLLDSVSVDVARARTEKQMVTEHGAHYFRLALSDHFRPDDPDVDTFLTFYKQLPKDAWLHYHCFAGMGRTTIYMVMHDILKNAANVSFDDIIQRQALIGIVDLSEIPDSKKNWGRKGYIERYQFVKHFYDYVHANPDLKLTWSAWAQKHGYETYTPDYSGYIWRLDAEDTAALPRNFRTTADAFKAPDEKFHLDAEYVPSREGLDSLHASGSAEFSVKEFAEMMKTLQTQAKGDLYVIDLRQESHGLFNGEAVSWYGARDWGNVGRSAADVRSDEQQRLQAAQGKSLIVSGLDKKGKPVNLKPETVRTVESEQQLVEAAGAKYIRIAATDHLWPSPECIDAFVALYQKLPQNAWLHFHCAAGVGRTTVYMAMYDMMHNPSVSLKDILYRQHLLGGTYLGYTVDKPKKGDWKADYYNDKARMIRQFYEYVQQNHENGYKTSWSSWLNRKENL